MNILGRHKSLGKDIELPPYVSARCHIDHQHRMSR